MTESKHMTPKKLNEIQNKQIASLRKPKTRQEGKDKFELGLDAKREQIESEPPELPTFADAMAEREDKLKALDDLESGAKAMQDLEDAMGAKAAQIQTEVASPTPPTSFQYHVCVVARIKGDNIFSDALVNVPKCVESAEDINALRSAMAQQLGAMPERVTIVTFQYVTAVYA